MCWEFNSPPIKHVDPRKGYSQKEGSGKESKFGKISIFSQQKWPPTSPFMAKNAVVVPKGLKSLKTT